MQFISFAQSLSVINKNGVRVPLQPSAQLLDYENARSRRDIVIKRRLTFFTTWELVRDLWTAIENPRTQVVVICADDMAVAGPYHQLLDMIEVIATRCELRSKTVRFPNESEIRFLAADSQKLIHGSAIHRLHVPEGAFFGETVDDFMMAKFECVPPNGEIVLESSLHEDGVFRKGFFFDVYRAALADSSWQAHVFGGPIPRILATPV